MDINNEAIQILVNEIKKMVNSIIDTSKFDKTVKGRITAILDQTTNQYLVRIDSNEYRASSCVSGLSVNDIVFITVAQNNYNNLIIQTKVNRNTL